MNFKEYQEAANRTKNNDAMGTQELLNYTLGLVGEAGEFAELVKKSVFHGHPVPHEEFDKELGDVLWYISQLARLWSVDLEMVAVKNIEKLKKRYPEKFTTEDSIARVDVE